jgi:DNA-binding NarL/FixJ family response regulator
VIVDDAPACRAAIRDLLERRGHQVVGEADSAATAIDLVERLAPDAVLLDVHLPDGSGFDVAAQLRENHDGLAVLMTSGDSDISLFARAAASRASGFVPKDDLGRVDLRRFWPVVRPDVAPDPA